MKTNSIAPRGRGATANPPNRFESISLERDINWNPEEDPAPRTQFLRDLSQSIISYNNSPDIPFSASLNPYRGCENGCSYCQARNTHEYGAASGQGYANALHVSLLRESALNPDYAKALANVGAGGPAVHLLGERLLGEGIESLKPPEKMLVMSDADVMSWLHRQVWLRSKKAVAPSWRIAMRHYALRI